VCAPNLPLAPRQTVCLSPEVLTFSLLPPQRVVRMVFSNAASLEVVVFRASVLHSSRRNPPFVSPFSTAFFS